MTLCLTYLVCLIVFDEILLDVFDVFVDVFLVVFDVFNARTVCHASA